MSKNIPSNAADVAALLDSADSSYEQWRKKLAEINDIRDKMCQCVDIAKNCMQAAVQSNITIHDCDHAGAEFYKMRHFGAGVKKLLDKVLDVILPENTLKQFPWKDDIDVVFSGSNYSMFDCNSGTVSIDIVSKKLKRAVNVFVPVKDAVDVNFLSPDLWTGKYVVRALSPIFSPQHDDEKARRDWLVIAVYTFPSSVIEALDAYFSGKLDNEFKDQLSWCRPLQEWHHFFDYKEIMNFDSRDNETSVRYIDRTLFESFDAVEFNRFNRARRYNPSIDHMLDDNHLLAPFRTSC